MASIDADVVLFLVGQATVLGFFFGRVIPDKTQPQPQQKDCLAKKLSVKYAVKPNRPDSIRWAFPIKGTRS